MRWLLISLLFVVAACGRPTEEQCERICWKAAEIAYKHKLDEKLAEEKDSDEREVLQEEAAEEWKTIVETPTNPELMRCVVSCQKDGRPSQIECIDKATTHKQVSECM